MRLQVKLHVERGVNWGWGKHRRHLDGSQSLNLRWFVLSWRFRPRRTAREAWDARRDPGAWVKSKPTTPRPYPVRWYPEANVTKTSSDHSMDFKGKEE